jgi:D-alanyl-D-alanine carboxypeptidase/D-alanyl-D-alanine-endopeptidase (penicillin-binding protein 4)
MQRIGWRAGWALALAGLAWMPAGASTGLPPEAAAALQRARVPLDAVAVAVQEAGSGQHVVSINATRAMNPASIAKLVTTYAALDQLGPAWTWATPVWFGGPVADGVLEGDLHIQGQGDPRLVIERLWLLLRRVQQLGVREVRGDIVLDRSAFAPPSGSPADFDGDPTRPYNVLPDALLVNYATVTYTFVPDAARGIAQVVADPDFQRAPPAAVPLSNGPCGDWRGALKATHGDGSYRFEGTYPLACGEMQWPLADASPAAYSQRLVELVWRQLGGRLGGQVRDGAAPRATPPTFEQRSPALADVVRDINKFSNNVMAQQLFLTLARQRQPGLAATAEAAREALKAWAGARMGELPSDWVIDNGSGLSRRTRLSALWLARLLQHAYSSPVMPELVASLPVIGIDGTLRRARSATGRAHLKTGSLRDVAGVAGYVLSDSGRRYVLVALVNHPNANAARAAIDALVQWVARDAPAGAAGRPATDHKE